MIKLADLGADPGAALDKPFARLMANMLHHAIYELVNGDIPSALSAHTWLIQDGDLYCEALGLHGSALDPKILKRARRKAKRKRVTNTLDKISPN